MRVLLLGATGTIGGAVLRACLKDAAVERVVALCRRDPGVSDPKVEVVLAGDFHDLSNHPEAFVGIDACFFCLGISANRVDSEQAYRHITFGITSHVAALLQAYSPEASFHYVSGQGTHVGSLMMWARVKGETELHLMQQVDACCYRPAFVDAPPSKDTPTYARVVHVLGPLLRRIPAIAIDGEDIGYAMIEAHQRGLRDKAFENIEICRLAKEHRDRQVA